MRLSRPRLLLRAGLLLVAAGFMAWRGFETRATAAQPGLSSEDVTTLGRIALVEWILAGLALLTAAAALLALRQRPRQKSLRLGEDRPGSGAGPSER